MESDTSSGSESDSGEKKMQETSKPDPDKLEVVDAAGEDAASEVVETEAVETEAEWLLRNAGTTKLNKTQRRKLLRQREYELQQARLVKASQKKSAAAKQNAGKQGAKQAPPTKPIEAWGENTRKENSSEDSGSEEASSGSEEESSGSDSTSDSDDSDDKEEGDTDYAPKVEENAQKGPQKKLTPAQKRQQKVPVYDLHAFLRMLPYLQCTPFQKKLEDGLICGTCRTEFPSRKLSLFFPFTQVCTRTVKFINQPLIGNAMFKHLKQTGHARAK
jgi:hypothetical protein